MDIPASVLEGT